jgi:hypothetical protein
MRRPWSCWTTPTRSRRPLELAGAAFAVLTLAACSPTAPPGVDRDQLDAAVSKAVGDPSSCVLIAKAGSGRPLYRYNTATACAREFAACDGPGTRKLSSLLEATAKDRQPRQLSCNTESDASRGVGWAAGPIEGTDLVYAAMMEGDRAFPGRMMADRLEGAFRRAKVSKP